MPQDLESREAALKKSESELKDREAVSSLRQKTDECRGLLDEVSTHFGA